MLNQVFYLKNNIININYKMDKKDLDNHLRKCNDTLIFLKISDFIRDNINNLNNLTIFDINHNILIIKKLIKSCDINLLKKCIERVESNYYNNENIKGLDVEENYIRNLINYYEILKKWKLKLENIKKN